MWIMCFPSPSEHLAVWRLPGTENIMLPSAEAPSRLRPSLNRQRDWPWRLVLRSYSSFHPSPLPSSSLLSQQSPGVILPRIPRDIPHPKSNDYPGWDSQNPPTPPWPPLRLFLRFLPTVLWQRPSTNATPLTSPFPFQIFLPTSSLLKLPAWVYLSGSIYWELYPKQSAVLTLRKANSDATFRGRPFHTQPMGSQDLSSCSELQ